MKVLPTLIRLKILKIRITFIILTFMGIRDWGLGIGIGGLGPNPHLVHINKNLVIFNNRKLIYLIFFFFFF